MRRTICGVISTAFLFVGLAKASGYFDPLSINRNKKENVVRWVVGQRPTESPCVWPEPGDPGDPIDPGAPDCITPVNCVV